MAGHSHSANIKHRKDAVDKKRAKIFSKIARKLIVESRLGGPDINTNPGLRLVFELARSANMTKDVIQRNIDKGAGIGTEGAIFEELMYEGYGNGGVAVLAEVLTDNRNRTAPEVKKIFEKAGGNMGEQGCVSYMFESKALFLIDPEGKTEDDIMEVVMEAEADDMEPDGDYFLVTTSPSSFIKVKEAFEAAGLKLEMAEVQRVSNVMIEVADIEQARKIQRLIDALEDNDDVQNVYTNHTLTDDVEKAMAEE